MFCRRSRLARTRRVERCPVPSRMRTRKNPVRKMNERKNCGLSFFLMCWFIHIFVSNMRASNGSDDFSITHNIVWSNARAFAPARGCIRLNGRATGAAERKLRIKFIVPGARCFFFGSHFRLHFSYTALESERERDRGKPDIKRDLFVRNLSILRTTRLRSEKTYRKKLKSDIFRSRSTI